MRSFVIMADIINSTSYDGKLLMASFKKVVEKANNKFSNVIQSPLTITLGDEFQGLVSTLSGAIEVIFYLDAQLLKENPGYKLRYVLNYGEIDTPINKDKSYEMLGNGLTEARRQLQNIKQLGSEVVITGLKSSSKQNTKLNLAFVLYRSFYNDWYEKDRTLVYDFIEGNGDYKDIARLYKKDPSSMWRKHKSLKIENFKASKELIKLLCDE